MRDAPIQAGESAPSTDWIEVRAATQPGEEGGRALESLLKRYQPWLVARLCHHFGFSREEAGDILQGFVHQKILIAGILARADPQRGHFRTFLLHTLDNYVHSELRHRHAQKRSPAGGEVISLEEVPAAQLPAHEDVPVADTEVAWAQAVIAGALLDMHNELARRARLDLWEVFEGRVLRPMLGDEPPLDYRTLVSRYGYKSPAEAFNALITAKRIFRRHLRSVLTLYTSANQSVDEELSRLRQLLEQ